MRARAKVGKESIVAVAPEETGHYRRKIRQRGTRIYASDIAWHIIEFGGVDETDLRADAARRDRRRLPLRAFCLHPCRTPSALPGGEQITSTTPRGEDSPMAQDPTELVVASYGDLYVAPSGTTLPTEWNSRLDPAFQNLGLTTEDGVTFGYAPEVQGFGAWQSKTDVRRELTRSDYSLTFSLEQWNAQSFQLAFGGGEVVEVRTGSYRYDFPDDTAALAAYAIVVDWQDGRKNYRLAYASGNVTESVEVQLQRTELAVLPVTFRPLGGVGNAPRFFSNDPSFVEGS